MLHEPNQSLQPTPSLALGTAEFRRYLNMTDYDDSYPTCVETSATLRVFSDDLDPSVISQKLNLEPTNTRRKGVMRVEGKLKTINRTNAWFLDSDKVVQSKDTRRHIDWIIEKLEGKESTIRDLRSNGVEMDIWCSWQSSGQGGPALDPPQMERLCRFGLSVGWEVWFVEEGESDNNSSNTDANSVGAG